MNIGDTGEVILLLTFSFSFTVYNCLRPLNIAGAYNVKVEGISIINSAFHSILMSGSHRPEEKTVISWVKIFTWRSNGDGINPFGNTLVEDSFIRTQDDSIYANGHGIRRTIFWQVNNMNELLKREALKKTN